MSKAGQVADGYAKAIADGDVKSCRMLRLAVDRYYRDLQRQNTDEFPFYFDVKSARIACEFFPTCLRHTRGEWRGRPFELTPSQAFITWNLFGWKRVEDQTRRFRKAYLLVARKWGKSTYAAGISHLLAGFDNEPRAQVLLSATKIEQAKIVYDEAEAMWAASPIKSMAEQRLNKMTYKKTGGYIRPVGSDKPFSGLGPHLVCMDELHEWTEQHRAFYDTMVTGSGALTQPLHMIITTAGSDESQLWIERDDYARTVLEGTSNDEALFSYIAELDQDDDIFDESNWIKANPHLGTSPKLEYMRELAAEASKLPSARTRFKRFNCNQRAGAHEDGISHELIESAVGPLSDWSQADGIAGGLDLGGNEDLASLALVAKFLVSDDEENGQVWRYEAKTWQFVSETSTRDWSEQPFGQWINEGRIERCRFVMSNIVQRAKELAELYGFQVFAFDPWNARGPAEQLELEGLTPVSMNQTHREYHEPIEQLQAAFVEGRFRLSDADPVVRWAFKNLTFHRNAEGKIKPDRKSNKKKIDAAVATVMAFRGVRVAPQRVHGSLFLG